MKKKKKKKRRDRFPFSAMSIYNLTLSSAHFFPPIITAVLLSEALLARLMRLLESKLILRYEISFLLHFFDNRDIPYVSKFIVVHFQPGLVALARNVDRVKI